LDNCSQTKQTALEQAKDDWAPWVTHDLEEPWSDYKASLVPPHDEVAQTLEPLRVHFQLVCYARPSPQLLRQQQLLQQLLQPSAVVATDRWAVEPLPSFHVHLDAAPPLPLLAPRAAELPSVTLGLVPSQSQAKHFVLVD